MVVAVGHRMNMIDERRASDWVIQAPAKLNLSFEVLNRREDGYHEIETLMVPIDLYDTLIFKEESTRTVELTCAAASYPGGSLMPAGEAIPEGADNLVVRAVELLRRRAKVNRGATIRLVKRIPAGAGLGGGSSDAAAALVAANRCWDLGLSRAELAELAAELGSDVPFFLWPGAAVCRGRGERVEPISAVGPLHFVVVRPPAGLSTAAVYEACHVADRPVGIEPILDALTRGDLSEAGRRLANRLRPAAAQLCPWIERLRSELARLDFLGHEMSGSGTCYFGLCRHVRHAKRLARGLEARGLGTVFLVRSSR